MIYITAVVLISSLLLSSQKQKRVVYVRFTSALSLSFSSLSHFLRSLSLWRPFEMSAPPDSANAQTASEATTAASIHNQRSSSYISSGERRRRRR
jgi:hypothetical protein